MYESYKVSHSGSITQVVSGKSVHRFEGDDGNLYVELEYYDGKTYKERVDFIVLCSHYRKSIDNEYCKHVNENKLECRLMNLEWCPGNIDSRAKSSTPPPLPPRNVYSGNKSSTPPPLPPRNVDPGNKSSTPPPLPPRNIDARDKRSTPPPLPPRTT